MSFFQNLPPLFGPLGFEAARSKRRNRPLAFAPCPPSWSKAGVFPSGLYFVFLVPARTGSFGFFWEPTLALSLPIKVLSCTEVSVFLPVFCPSYIACPAFPSLSFLHLLAFLSRDLSSKEEVLPGVIMWVCLLRRLGHAPSSKAFWTSLSFFSLFVCGLSKS